MQNANDLLKFFQDNLSLLASQAGMVIERLWFILTKQQVLYGVQKAVLGLLIAIGGVISWKTMNRAATNKRLHAWDRNVVTVGLFFATIVLLFWATNFVVDSLPRLFNPEYYSLKEAVEMLQRVK